MELKRTVLPTNARWNHPGLAKQGSGQIKLGEPAQSPQLQRLEEMRCQTEGTHVSAFFADREEEVKRGDTANLPSTRSFFECQSDQTQRDAVSRDCTSL